MEPTLKPGVCLIPKDPSHCVLGFWFWQAESSLWKQTANSPEEKLQSKPASCEATETKCLQGLIHWHPSWAIAVAASSQLRLLRSCWSAKCPAPGAGINVSCPCTGDGFLSSFGLKMWVGRDQFPYLRCHGSPRFWRKGLALMIAKVLLALTSYGWELSVPCSVSLGQDLCRRSEPSRLCKSWRSQMCRNMGTHVCRSMMPRPVTQWQHKEFHFPCTRKATFGKKYWNDFFQYIRDFHV